MQTNSNRTDEYKFSDRPGYFMFLPRKVASRMQLVSQKHRLDSCACFVACTFMKFGRTETGGQRFRFPLCSPVVVWWMRTHF